MELEMVDAVIVGGSIASLMHAVVLRSLGRKVIVLESREYDELHAEAAGLSLGPNAQRLVWEYLDIDESFAIRTPNSQILSPAGAIVADIPMTLSVTTCTWSLVFQQLKAKFLNPSVHGPPSVYKSGVRVDRFEYSDRDSVIKIIFTDKGDRYERTIEAPLVIGADGARSTIRTQIQPHVQPQYAGYVAWRGCVPEAQTPEILNGVLESKLIFTLLQGQYIIAYLTPGESGSTEQGERLLDWAWYCPVEAGSLEFIEIMTDATGHRHNKTVPRGRLRDEVWDKQLSNHELPGGWNEVIHKSQQPFVTAITSFESSSTTFCDGKLFLVGEAFTQFRPHLGLSCDLAALQALTLSDMLKGEKSIEEYRKVVGEYARKFSIRSTAMGQFGLTGKWLDVLDEPV